MDKKRYGSGFLFLIFFALMTLFPVIAFADSIATPAFLTPAGIILLGIIVIGVAAIAFAIVIAVRNNKNRTKF